METLGGGESKRVNNYYLPPDGSPFTLDITFCDTGDCPFTECQRHKENLKGRKKSVIISVSGFGGVCRKYIGWLVVNAEKTQRENIRKEVEEQLG